MNSLAEQGTPQSGYEAKGPYHCEDCIHKLNKSDLCMHPKVVSDPQLASKVVERDGKKFVRIDEQRGCCSYVNQSGRHEGNDHDADDYSKFPGKLMVK